jgi:DNA-binding response OmpR family regulator
MAINDNQDILQMLQDVLTYEGYEFAGQRDPEFAVDDLDRFKPDLIILDWLFGREGRGMELLELMKLHPATSATPVLVCSAATNTVQEVEDSLRAKGIGVLYKPFQLADLVGAIRNLLPGSSPRTVESS